MHKTPASTAGVSDQLGGDPFPHTRNREILKANPAMAMRLAALLWHARRRK